MNYQISIENSQLPAPKNLQYKEVTLFKHASANGKICIALQVISTVHSLVAIS